MSNPWNRSLQEATLSSFLDQLDDDSYSCDQKRLFTDKASLKSYSAIIAAKLDDDPSDLITRLRRADVVIARCGDVDDDVVNQRRSSIIIDREVRSIDTVHKELLSLLEELHGNVRILEAGTNSRADLVQMLRRDTSVLEHALLGRDRGGEGGGGGDSCYTLDEQSSIAVQQCVQSCRRLIDRMDAEEDIEGGGEVGEGGEILTTPSEGLQQHQQQEEEEEIE